MIQSSINSIFNKTFN